MTIRISYKLIIFIIATLVSFTAVARVEDTVEIEATGYGTTLEEATDNAIKHALELAT